MSMYTKIATKDIALTICCVALYAVLSFFPVSQIIGLLSKTITVGTIIIPIIGLLLGPYLGGIPAILGGMIGLLFNPYFSIPSLVSGGISALYAGILYIDKQEICAVIYLSFLLIFGFYPSVGPLWLHPMLLWFQVMIFFILVSPLQRKAIKNLNSDIDSHLLPSLYNIPHFNFGWLNCRVLNS